MGRFANLALMLMVGTAVPLGADWQSPPANSPASTTGRAVYYFRSEGTVLCREVEEDVWSDARVRAALDSKSAYRVDVDDPSMNALLRRHKVFLVPTVVVVENGNEVGRLVRNASREEYLRLLTAKPGTFTATRTPAPGPTSGPGQSDAIDPRMVSAGDDTGDVAQPSLDITSVSAKVDATALTIRLGLAGPPIERLGAYNVFIDYDGDSSTGYTMGQLVGIDYLAQGRQLNKFQGATSSEWNWAELRIIELTPASRSCTFVLPIKSQTVADFQKARIFAQTQDEQWATVDEAPSLGPLTVRP